MSDWGLGLAPASPSGVAGLADPLALLSAAIARGLEPPPLRTVGEWAEQCPRIVPAESGSRWPGPWSNDIAPELVEVMECLTLSHPAREVTYCKSAQVAGSEGGLNLIGKIIDEDPAPGMVILPTLDEAKKYVKIKLQPMLEATPALRRKVREQKSRDEDGSTTSFKKFPGGFLQVTGANSSKGLQMISTRFQVREEISEWPFDVDGRGDPMDLADARCKIFEGREKKYNVSTPGIKGNCRVTVKFEAGDQRRRYLPCTHCGTFQQILWERMEKSDPAKACYPCAACGAIVEHRHMRAMRKAGHWLKCFPAVGDNLPPPALIAPQDIGWWLERRGKSSPSCGRQPSFAINVLHSPVETWSAVVQRWLDAQGHPRKLKVFYQQDLGEAFEEKGDAPDWEELLKARQDFAWQHIPPGALFVTAAVDVQHNRLEVAVYAWGVGFTSWLIDKRVIEGDPARDAAWKQLDTVLEGSYPDRHGKPWRIDLAGIDSGYLTHRVRMYVRGHAGSGRVLMLKGFDGWGRPPIGTATKQDVDFDGRKIGTVMQWPVGTFDLKVEQYEALQLTLQGPDKATGKLPIGAAHYNDRCDEMHFRQLTAESIAIAETRNGIGKREWVKDRSTPNEQLDLAVYARGLAHHLADQLTPPQWAELAAARNAAPAEVQRDLAELWSPRLADGPAAAPAGQTPPPARADEDDFDERLSRHYN